MAHLLARARSLGRAVVHACNAGIWYAAHSSIPNTPHTARDPTKNALQAASQLVMRPALRLSGLRSRLGARLHTRAPSAAQHASDTQTFDIPQEPRYAADLASARPRPSHTPRADLRAALEANAAPPKLWQAYKAALEERMTTADDGSVQLPPALGAEQHRQILRRIGPVQLGAKVRARARALRAADLGVVDRHTDLSTPAEHVRFTAGVSPADAATYRRRAQLVLHNLERAGGAATEDYNCALNLLAQDGHVDEMFVLWDDLCESRKRGGAAPNSKTYNYMMFGMVRRLQQRTARLMELFGPALVPGRRGRQSGVGNAQRIVAHASQLASQQVMKLVSDMLADDVVPNALTLDYAARLLRMTGQMPAFVKLLRLGFGVDILHPDAAPRGLCEPTTQTLNTALMALGEHGTVSAMLAVYEVMTNPMGHRKPVPPNTTTFATLIKHACSAPDTLFFAAALHPAQQTWLGSLQRLFGQSPGPALMSPDERDSEIHKRRTGMYQAVACYVVSESIKKYADGVMDLADGLHVALPDAAGLDPDSMSELVRTRELEWHADGDEGIPRVIDGALVGKAVPLVFRPPLVAPTAQTLYPVFVHASRRRHPVLLRWLISELDVLYVMRMCEEAVLRAALDHLAPSTGADAIHASIAMHHARVERELSALAWLRFKRLPARLAFHAEYQRTRKLRRRHAKLQQAKRTKRARRS